MLITALALAAAIPECLPRSRGATAVERDLQKVEAILKRIDAEITDTSIYSDDVVHMAQGSRPITSRAELQKALAAQASYGRSKMTHEVITLHYYADMVLTRGLAGRPTCSSQSASMAA